MRLFFGSDIIGNQKIFSVSVTATNCTYTGSSIITVGSTTTLIFTADTDYNLPSTVIVTGASYTWDDTTGVLVLSDVTANVTVKVVAEAATSVYDPVFANNSWSAIRTAARNNEIPVTWQVGDTKSVTLTDNTVMTVRICDKTAGRYALADGTGYSNMVFEFVQLLHYYSPMNSVNTNNGGWAECDMKSTTMPQVYTLLPIDIKNAISEVVILSGIGNGSTSGVSFSSNRLFLPCEYEIFGAQFYSIGMAEAGVSGQFEYYTVYTTDSYKRKYIDNSVEAWWLRSPVSGSTNRFCRVSYRGVADYTDASDNIGTALPLYFAI